MRCFDVFVYIVKFLISIVASSWSNYSEKSSWFAMLSLFIKQAYEIFGMNYFPPEPTADNVLMETWEVWTTKNNYRSLWRVTTYESGWMDWWLSNVSTLYAFALVQVLFSTMALWLSFVLLHRSQAIEVSCENKGFGVELFRCLQMGKSECSSKTVWGIWLNALSLAIARHALEHTTNGGWKTSCCFASAAMTTPCMGPEHIYSNLISTAHVAIEIEVK